MVGSSLSFLMTRFGRIRKIGLRADTVLTLCVSQVCYLPGFQREEDSGPNSGPIYPWFESRAMMWSPVAPRVDKTKFAPMLSRETQFDRTVPNRDAIWSMLEEGSYCGFVERT